MDPQAAANVALVGVTSHFVYSYIKKWWLGNRITKRYIAMAAEMQAVTERCDCPLDLNEATYVEILDIKKPEKESRRPKHGYFGSYLVQQGKAKFGTPARSNANRMVVRKYLYDICTDAGLKARHIIDHLDIATELVFVPSRVEIVAMAVQHTKQTKSRVKTATELGRAPHDVA
jgi:hypothetical protein